MPYLPSLLEQLGVNSPSEQRLKRRHRQAGLVDAGALRAPTTEGLWGKGLHSKRRLAAARARLRPESAVPDAVPDSPGLSRLLELETQPSVQQGLGRLLEPSPAEPEVPEELADALAFQEAAEGSGIPGLDVVKGGLDAVKGLLDTKLDELPLANTGPTFSDILGSVACDDVG